MRLSDSTDNIPHTKVNNNSCRKCASSLPLLECSQNFSGTFIILLSCRRTMVSPLSSRILNLEAKAKINIRAPVPHNPKRTSGYSADKESTKTSEVVQAQKQDRVNQVESQAKKRRLEELNFQAANARDDLRQNGIQCLPGLIGRSRALPLGTVDMSTVKLIVRSKGQPCHEAVATKAPLEETPSTNTYHELLDACKSFYESSGPMNPADVNAADYHGRPPSTTSTITSGESFVPTSDADSDSDDTPLVIPARLKEKTNKKEKGTEKSNQDELQLEPLSSPFLSLEEALHQKETAT